jgi:hypothetical protein
VQIAWDPTLEVRSVSGWREVAVLREGRWVPFQIDLSNESHVQAFWRGEIPEGIRL